MTDGRRKKAMEATKALHAPLALALRLKRSQGPLRPLGGALLTVVCFLMRLVVVARGI